MEKQAALKIIEQNRESYDKIAKSFDVTRKYEWPEFEWLAPYIKKDDRILDIGCGNGRLWEYLNMECGILNMEYFGIDQSKRLIGIAKKKFSKAGFRVVGKVWELPLKDKEFDIVAGIAFLHHIPSEELRLKVLKEIYRVLKPGGVLFLTNWNLWQWNRIKKYKLRLRDFLFPHNGLDAGDFWITFHNAKRYYHHFTKRELIRLCKKAGFKKIKYKLGMNSVIILTK